MRNIVRPQARHRRALSLALMSVQLIATAWVPVVHARTVVLASAPTVEDAHSADCSEFHVETRCRTCAASINVFATPARRHKFEIGGATDLPRDVSTRGIFSQAFSPSNPVRAPPSL